MSAVLLDTNAVIWFMARDRPERDALEAIAAAQSAGGVFVSPRISRPSTMPPGSDRAVTHYLLDTNIISDLVRHPHGRVAERIRSAGEAHICTGNDLLIAAPA